MLADFETICPGGVLADFVKYWMLEIRVWSSPDVVTVAAVVPRISVGAHVGKLKIVKSFGLVRPVEVVCSVLYA